MPTCPGCNTWFSVGGYSSHIKQTKTPACIAIRDTQENFGDLTDLETDDSDNKTAKHSEGDALGTYDDVSFDGSEIDGPNFDSEDEEDEWGVGPGDDEDAENGAQEGGWEPPVPEGFGDEAMDEEEDQNHDDIERDGSPEPNLRDVPLVDKGARPFVVNYPDARAGAPTTDERGCSGWKLYEGELGEGGPWVSKLDWDFARWALLRGPGATALTELLKIDGVRLCDSCLLLRRWANHNAYSYKMH